MRHHYIAWALPFDASEPHGLSIIQDLDRDTVLCGLDGDSADVHEIAGHLGSPGFTAQLEVVARALGVPLRENGALPQAVTTQLRESVNDLAQLEPILIDREQGYFRVIRLPEHAEAWIDAYAAIDGDDLDGYRIRGLNIDDTVFVDPTHRELGIGSALYAARLLDRGELLSWTSRPHSFSTSGIAAARRGLDLAKRACVPLLENEALSL
ncbi:hypothetical protein KUV57_12130 [Epibacterium sp. DP7N7-1]|nr:hypothetical protein [Epibacterium sp. DP7N7-1]